MKVLGISCSLRKRGNTEILVEEALAGAREAGAEAELLTLIGKEIKPCDGCLSCIKTGKCKINDDMRQISEKLLESDGIIIGTPVYFWSVAGQTKVLIDRWFDLLANKMRLANKVGGIIVVGARIGLMDAAKVVQAMFAANHMISADIVAGLASAKGAVRKDKFAMMHSREMGKQVVSLIKKGFEFPEEYKLPLYAYVEEKYGLTSSPFDKS